MFNLPRFLLLLTCFVASMSTTMCTRTLGDSDVKNIEDIVKSIMKGRDVPGLGLSIVKDGKTVLKKGYGMADVENKIPINDDTLFPIASMSKQMSASLLAILMAEKGIAWTTKVKDLLDDFKMPTDYMTENTNIDDIIAHRTGLAQNDFSWLNGEFERDDTYSRMRFFSSKELFRDKHMYNNIVFSVIAKLCEKFGGKSWETLMEERLFRPLGMTSSTFYDKEAPDWKNFAKAYGKNSNSDPLWHVNPFAVSNVGAVGPAGSIVSTVNDMTKYLHFLVSGGKTDQGTNLLPKEKLHELFYPVMVLPQPWFGGALELPVTPFTRSMDAYSRGWTVGWYRGFKIISHFGNLYGYDGLISYLPDFNTAIWSSTNGPMGRPAVIAHLLLQNYITDVVIGEKPWLDTDSVVTYPQPWGDKQDFHGNMPVTAIAKDLKLSRPLTEYLGEYGNFELGNVTMIKNDDGVLEMEYGTIGRYLLHPQSDTDRFSIESVGAMAFMREVNTRFLVFSYVQFNTNNMNDIVSVSVSFLDYGNPPVLVKNLKLYSNEQGPDRAYSLWKFAHTVIGKLVGSSQNQPPTGADQKKEL